MIRKLFAARFVEFGIPVYEPRPGIIRSDRIKAIRKVIAERLMLLLRWGEPVGVDKAMAIPLCDNLAHSTGRASRSRRA